MRIRATIDNIEGIQAALDAEQEGVSNGVITAGDLLACIGDAERRLGRLLPTRSWTSIRLEINPSYRPTISHAQDSTYAEIERTSGGYWIITWIWRGDLNGPRIAWPNAAAFNEQILRNVERGRLWGQKPRKGWGE